MFLATALLLTTIAAAAPGAASVAVVDLSPSPDTPLADALRKLPDLRGRALSAARTAAVVADAEGLGLVCSVDDISCLQKLVVLARVGEIVAFTSANDVVILSHVTARRAWRGEARGAGSAASRARAAWASLEEELGAGRKAPPSDDPAPPAADAEEPGDDAAPGDEDQPDKAPDSPAGNSATSSGWSAPLLVTIGGAVGTVGFAAAALAVSVDLANQLRAADQGVPLGEGYYGAQTAFVALGAASALSLVAVGAGAVWLALDHAGDDAAAGPPAGPPAGPATAGAF